MLLAAPRYTGTFELTIDTVILQCSVRSPNIFFWQRARCVMCLSAAPADARNRGSFVRLGSLRPSALGLFGLALFVLQAQAAVTPPPLPPGSALVQPGPGINPEEQARGERAHHQKTGFHSDPSRDDSSDAAPMNTLNPFVPLGRSPAAGLAPSTAFPSRNEDSK